MAVEILRNDDDAAWRADGERNGWVLPPKAAWPLRLPVMRWLRATYHTRAAATVAEKIGMLDQARRRLASLMSAGRRLAKSRLLRSTTAASCSGVTPEAGVTLY